MRTQWCGGSYFFLPVSFLFVPGIYLWLLIMIYSGIMMINWRKKKKCFEAATEGKLWLSLSWDFHILEWHDLSLLQKHSLCLSKAVQWPKKEWVANSLGKYKQFRLKKTCIAIHVALHCFNLFRLWKNLLVSCKFDLLALSFNMPRTIYRQCSVVSLSMHFS